MSLYPTKTRLRLLAAVADRQVFRDVMGDDYISGDRKVSARIAEVEQAGWVQLGERDRWGIRYWRLTDAGRAVLAEAVLSA